MSVKIQIGLLFALMLVLAAAYSGIDGGFLIAVIVYAIGGICLWIQSIAGAKSPTRTIGRMIRRNGVAQGGYASRREWDQSGQITRVLLHVASAMVALLFADDAGQTLQSFLLAACFSLGVESSFVVFKTGNEDEQRRYLLRRRRRPPPTDRVAQPISTPPDSTANEVIWPASSTGNITTKPEADE